MTPAFPESLIGLLGCLLIFILVQRLLHQELQAVLLLLTRRPTLTIGLYSFLFFPGVLLHELSHWLMAKLLRVRTGRLSLIPKLMGNGELRMGFVETAKVDFFRESLIGAAPLVTGGAVIAWLGSNQLGLITPQWGELYGQGNWSAIFDMLAKLPQKPDFWLWLYLAFAVSTTMLPSASDRRGWTAVGITAAVLLGLGILAGAGPWLLQNAAPGFSSFLTALTAVFFISLVVHLVLIGPVFLLRLLLNRITGLTVTQ